MQSTKQIQENSIIESCGKSKLSLLSGVAACILSMGMVNAAPMAYAQDTCEIDGAGETGGAVATGSQSLACGSGSEASGSGSTAVGENATASANDTTAVGEDAMALTARSTALGGTGPCR